MSYIGKQTCLQCYQEEKKIFNFNFYFCFKVIIQKL